MSAFTSAFSSRFLLRRMRMQLECSRVFSCVLGVLAAITVCSLDVLGGETTINFDSDIRPILSDACYHCHGPDPSSREAGLRLDLADQADAANVDDDSVLTDVLSAGEVRDSQLWQRITSDDPDVVMPPADSHRPPLTAEQQSKIKQWIEQGAKVEKFWAYRPIQPPAMPQSAAARALESPIDAFVVERLQGQSPQADQLPEAAPLAANATGAPMLKPSADRRTLLRRLTLDLTGLPPTREELHAFLQDETPAAYEKQVDRLLNSARYGEHMAKYWLDLVRFADTNGIHHDHFREMTPYRDWVIRSYNQNLPYDKFVVAQVAGDLLASPSQDELIASGFNRLHLVIDRGTALPEESHVRNVVDRTTAFGTAFMGLTVGCAVCHDHKYDPITQRDFYQLYAFFNNIDATPETPGRNVHEPALRLPTPEQTDELERLQQAIAQTNQLIAKAKGSISTKSNSDNSPDGGSSSCETDDQEQSQQEITKLQQELAELKSRMQSVQSQVLTTLIMKERKDPRPAHILIRGAYDNPGEEVQRSTPSFLPPLQSRGQAPDRLDLARWITSPEHPLLARVTVNRIWQQFFGVGLVRTSEDFGNQGEVPSHPKLLDYLASEYIASGWNTKQLIRRIVMTETYRQTSEATPGEYKSDPDNRMLARGARFRLDSEVIRDQILFTSGLLYESLYGKSVKPPQPPGLWKNVSMKSSSTYSFVADRGQDIVRRSIYTFWKRALPPPQMTIFDAPTRESCIARRERTNTPLQALVLMNEGLFVDAAATLASQLLVVDKYSGEEAINVAFESITSHTPTEYERTTLLQGYQSLRESYATRQEEAKNLAHRSHLKTAIADDQAVDCAAMTLTINAIYSLDTVKNHQ